MTMLPSRWVALALRLSLAWKQPNQLVVAHDEGEECVIQPTCVSPSAITIVVLLWGPGSNCWFPITLMR